MKAGKGDAQSSRVRDLLAQAYSRVLIPEADGSAFNAEIPEFPGCFACGATREEALANLERSAESWLEACLAQGKEIPPPAAERTVSGKVLLRLPRSLHARAARMAALDGVSLNQFIVQAVTEKTTPMPRQQPMLVSVFLQQASTTRGQAFEVCTGHRQGRPRLLTPAKR